MLKIKNNANDIVTLVLASGQEILGKFVTKEGDNVIVDQPVMLVQSPEGQMGFQAFSMTGDATGQVEFQGKNVVAVVDTRSDIAQSYRSATSGIVVPEENPGIIV